jgi:hypothetical protein
MYVRNYYIQRWEYDLHEGHFSENKIFTGHNLNDDKNTFFVTLTESMKIIFLQLTLHTLVNRKNLKENLALPFSH